MPTIGMEKHTRLSYDQALAQLPDLLKSEGFGIITSARALRLETRGDARIGCGLRDGAQVAHGSRHLAYASGEEAQRASASQPAAMSCRTRAD
jgi:hypothetical protein